MPQEDLRKEENDSKTSNMQTLRVLDKEKRQNEERKSRKKKSFSRIERQTNMYTHIYKFSRTERYSVHIERTQVPSPVNKNRPITMQIIVKFQSTWDKVKILQAFRKKTHLKRNSYQNDIIFSRSHVGS